jgi:hypothetical protein
MADNPYAAPSVPSDPAATDPVSTQVSIMCPACRAAIHIGDEACSGCGRRVTKDEKAALQRRWEASDRDIATASEQQYWGRVALAVASAVASVHAVLLLGVPVLGPLALVIALVLWGCFVFSFSSPLESSIAGLAVYSLWWLGQLVFATLMAFDGLLIRILVLSALIASVGAEWNLRRRRQAVVSSRR